MFVEDRHAIDLGVFARFEDVFQGFRCTIGHVSLVRITGCCSSRDGFCETDGMRIKRDEAR
jgi:hypothetical protein